MSRQGQAIGRLEAQFVSQMDNQRLDRKQMENVSTLLESVNDRVTTGGGICDARMDGYDQSFL